MASLLTNVSALTALRTLRGVQRTADIVRSEISTGLKVQSAKDNPAFFLVSTKTKGDQVVLSGLRDNLTMTEGAIRAARAGIDALDRITLALADMVAVSQNGIAVAELEATFDDLLDQAVDIIDAASFQGANLLKQEGSTNTVIGVDRTGSSLAFQNLAVRGGDFLNKQFNNAIIESANYFVLQANNFSARQDVGGNAWVDSVAEPGMMQWGLPSDPTQIYTNPADIIANSPRLDYRVQITNPGRYYINVRGRGFNGTSDSIHVGIDGNVITGSGGVRIPGGAGGRWGTRETNTNQRVFVDIAAPGLYTINIWGRENGTAVEGIEFTDNPAEPTGTTPLPPVTAIGGSDLPFFTDPIDGERRREQAGFMELLRLVNPEAMRLAPESAMLLIDSARSKLNRYGAELGAYEDVVTRQRSYLADLTGNLGEGVAALIEADLEEASSRLQAVQVQEQLAIQGLTTSNERSGLVLSLFR